MAAAALTGPALLGSQPIAADVLHAGTTTGPILRLTEPLSLWGGTAPDGTITDPHHPQRGARLAGAVVVMTTGRGSSSSSSVLTELLRAGHGPAAFVLAEPDGILTLGALVAAELYDVHLPIALVTAGTHAALPSTGQLTSTARATADHLAPMALTAEDAAMLAGEHGPGVALAMRLIVALARASGARELLSVRSAHVDGCLYHGPASLDFAQRLVDLGASVAVPTTSNVGSVDLLHPEVVRGDPEERAAGRALMQAYVRLGCRTTFTCAPYQDLAARPARGEHVAWAESNAIAFVNSVVGARTARYGDFVDVSAAITGRVPAASYHLDEHRRADLVVDVARCSTRPTAGPGLLAEDAGWGVLGLVVGERVGSGVPVIVGAPATTTEDQLKAFAAGAASSGTVGLFHVVGVTPEAPELAAVLPDRDLDTLVLTGRRPPGGARPPLPRRDPAAGRGQPRHPALLARRVRPAGGAARRRRPAVPPGRRGVRVELPGGARRGARCGPPRRHRSGRGDARGGHVHVRDHDPRAAGAPRDDELREVGLVRAVERRGERHPRDAGGVRRVSSRGSGGPRRAAVAMSGGDEHRPRPSARSDAPWERGRTGLVSAARRSGRPPRARRAPGRGRSRRRRRA
jgi:cis-L-3-hydroxyproline dehydratase